MKILLADDHQVVREGLKQILRNIKISDRVEEANNGTEALNKIKSGEFDFVILDISMPGQSGLDILKALKNCNINVSILILSVHPQKQYAVRALKLGAAGYISKNSAPEELELAIKKISAGERYVSSDIIGKLVSDFNRKNDIALHESLSEREFQVMCFLAKGTPIKEIGKVLFVSERTVSTHRRRLLEKMEMKSNAELALYAYKNDLIE
ncbi:MAG: response regulator transcription factor [Bacteroidales bacterium]|jgi:DNA-binding NarL/FixJ family response regulator|nr:response regulator transcription factor [Bacteroidales bacterium]